MFKLHPLFACLLFIAVLAGCTRQPMQSGPYTVRIPLAQADGSYQFQNVTLKSVSDLRTLNSSTVRWAINPGMAGSHVRAKSLSGYSPEAQFYRNADGVYVPKDNETLELFSIVHHMEQLQQWDKELEIAQLNKWPRTVGVKFTGLTSEPNQAMYTSEVDAYLFFPYVIKDVPLSMNAGVIAHEHFHSLFYQLFEKPLIQTLLQKQKDKGNVVVDDLSLSIHQHLKSQNGKDSQATLQDEFINKHNETIARGLNEGLADVWGLLYAGDPQFVGRSLPNMKMDRDMDETANLPSDDEMLRRVGTAMLMHSKKKMEDALTGEAYELGAQVARVLRQYQVTFIEPLNLSANEQRNVMARKLIAALATTDTQDFSEKSWSVSSFFKSFIATAITTREVSAQVVLLDVKAECAFWNKELRHLIQAGNFGLACEQN